MSLVDKIKNLFRSNDNKISDGQDKINYIELIEQMFFQEEAFEQFKEYKRILEENPRLSSKKAYKKLTTNGPYSNEQLDMLLNNPNISDCVETMYEVCVDRQDRERRARLYNSIIDENSCYKSAKTFPVTDMVRKTVYLYKKTVNNNKEDIYAYAEVLKDYKSKFHQTDSEINDRCSALLADLPYNISQTDNAKQLESITSEPINNMRLLKIKVELQDIRRKNEILDLNRQFNDYNKSVNRAWNSPKFNDYASKAVSEFEKLVEQMKDEDDGLGL